MERVATHGSNGLRGDTATRVVVACVGYRNLRDLSVGPMLIPTLSEYDWPLEVEVDDWSFGPIAVVQRLEDQPGYYDRIVFVGAVERGREPGLVVCYRWQAELPGDEEIQQRIGEAIMGVISLDNLLIITTYFGVLPDDVLVIEVEPEDTGWGEGFTPAIEHELDRIITTVRQAALDGVSALQ